MRSSLPIFIFVGLALIIAIGVAILGASAGSAVAEVGDTATEELPLAVFETSYFIFYGLGFIFVIIAMYFALRMMLKR
jgi:fucose permease